LAIANAELAYELADPALVMAVFEETKAPLAYELDELAIPKAPLAYELDELATPKAPLAYELAKTVLELVVLAIVNAELA
jgi:hypothetical protein